MPMPPSIPRITILRNLPGMMREPISVFHGYVRKYGNNFLMSVGGSRRTHFTVDADVARHVLQRNHRNYEKSEIQTSMLARFLGRGLLTNTGRDWLRQRRLIQPGFHRERLATLVTEMQAVIDQQCLRLEEAAASGGTVLLHDFTRGTVFRIISRAIFTDGFNEAETRWLNEAIDRIQAYVIYPIRMPFLRGPLRWFGFNKKYVALSREVRRRVAERIEARRKAEPRDDLLQMLLDTRYEDTGEPMTDERLIDEIIILFAAGHETSANALAWTLWLLGRHPVELRKVRAEIAAAEAAGPIDLAGVRRLPYLTQVIEESMRLYPPAWITDRVALGPDSVGDYTIEEGTVVGIFFHGLHRNPAYWEKPETFCPERMSVAAKKDRHPFAYLLFGGGPRLCIGNHFAMLEMQLFLARVLRDYDFVLPPDADEVGVLPTITLGMDREIRAKVNRKGTPILPR